MNNWQIKHVPEVGSTMELARDLIAELDQVQPVQVSADQQTAGRGRRGSVWSQADQGLYVTYGLPIEGNCSDLSAFTLVAGLAVAHVLVDLGYELRLKWPNDLYTVEGAKFGGILCEVIHQKKSWLLVGIGVNIQTPCDVERKVSSLCELPGSELSNRDIDAKELKRAIGHRLLENFNLYIEQGFLPFQKLWESIMYRPKEMVTVKVTEDRELRGLVQGVSDLGELLLNDGVTLHKISTGEVCC